MAHASAIIAGLASWAAGILCFSASSATHAEDIRVLAEKVTE
jgi:hypothetical protein